MTSKSIFKYGLAGLAALSAAACASAPPSFPAVTEAPTDCAEFVDVGEAVLIAPEKEGKKNYEMLHGIDSYSSCVTSPNGDNNYYVIFELPEVTENRVFTIGSRVEGMRILSPKISMLDSEGVPIREVKETDMFFRGLLYSTQIRPRENEQYILFETDGTKVGDNYDSIVTGFTMGTQYSFSSSSEVARRRKFSYHGDIMITVKDISDSVSTKN